MTKNQLITTSEIINAGTNNIKNRIYTIRNTQVMIDRDLAELYQVPVKALNQAVKRNIERFPESFCFQLNLKEKDELVTNCDHLKTLKYSSNLPYVFTEQGVSMLSGVLKSETAIKVSIQIITAFVSMRKFILKNAEIFCRLDYVERKQIEFESKTEQNFEKVFNAIEDKSFQRKQGIFFDGQIFDAYHFVSDIIRTAQSSIVLIDNYVDDSILTLFTKRNKCVNVIIYTKEISKQLSLDLEKHNLQYLPIEIREFKKSHDRFLIIDNKEIYHFGASLKDLGKKWFAFQKFDKESVIVLQKLFEKQEKQ
jgi:hypothetical protein